MSDARTRVITLAEEIAVLINSIVESADEKRRRVQDVSRVIAIDVELDLEQKGQRRVM
jgi:hypothetical protein